MKISALRVHQWLDDWDSFRFDPEERQKKPKPFYYVCSMSAPLLKRLSGVQRRQDVGPRAGDLGIQRGHDEDRSKKIANYVAGGYPWGALNTTQKGQFEHLKKPGWLPTAVVGNIVGPKAKRGHKSADPASVIEVEDLGNDFVNLILPEGSDGHNWQPAEDGLEPIEIIDGQHRLFAFAGDEAIKGRFDLPVVLFDDLDISWQAYLFWTINIRPKRINPSMAFDLYPLLRTAEWLEPRVDGPKPYRETRAQELTEALWSHPESSWLERIGMLGREKGKVTQAAFVRSLTLSFVRSWAGSRRTGIGGLYGTEYSEDRTDVLTWSRAQQAAYLIFLWSGIETAIERGGEGWITQLREATPAEATPGNMDPAFAGQYAMLATDQGVRGFLQVCNDISFELRNEVRFQDWQRIASAEATNIDEVSEAIADLKSQSAISGFVERLMASIVTFDWRSAVTPGLDPETQIRQGIYRSGSGYRQVRLQLLRHLAESGCDEIAGSAKRVGKALGYIEG